LSYLNNLSLNGDISPLTKQLFTRTNPSREALLKLILAHLFILYSKSNQHRPMYLSQNIFNEDHRPFGPVVDHSMTIRGLINTFKNHSELFTVTVAKPTDKRVEKERIKSRPATEVSMTPKLYGMFYEYGWKVTGLTEEAIQFLSDTQILRDYHSKHVYKIGNQVMDTSYIRRNGQKDGSLGRIHGHPWQTQTRSAIDCSNWSIDGDTDLVMLDFDQFAPRSLAILHDLKVPSDPYPVIHSVCGEYQLTRETVKLLFSVALSTSNQLAHALPKKSKLTPNIKRHGKYLGKTLLSALCNSNPVINNKQEFKPNHLIYQYRSLESDLMMIVIQACNAFDIGICTIHDGVFCRRKDAEQVKSFMLSAVKSTLAKRGLSNRATELTISLKETLSKPHKPIFIDESINQ
jgi:hypothetical protein